MVEALLFRLRGDTSRLHHQRAAGVVPMPCPQGQSGAGAANKPLKYNNLD
jgi:hypothetical protein